MRKATIVGCSGINKFPRVALSVLVALLAVMLANWPASGLTDDSVAVERRLADTTRYLSSDELEGRGLGSKGIDLAADYIATQFRLYGLKTDRCNGTPFQKFQVATDAELGPDNRLTLLGPPSPGGGKPETMELALGKDFTPLAISGSGSFDLPLVFVGYGITARSAHYDDYANVDVNGKAVIVLRHQPRESVEDKASAGMKDGAFTPVPAQGLQRLRTRGGRGDLPERLCRDPQTSRP